MVKTHKGVNGKPTTISSKTVIKYLGPERNRFGFVEKENQVGIVTGLAWTQFGGELLCVETVTMPGKGNFTVSGKLGDVMKESAKAAISYVRSRSEQFNVDQQFHEKLDIHIHVPEGAIPKDGPSAGIAMCTAIISALTRLPVDRNMAMTGEITLRGRVLPIGGLKEKALGALRSGIRTIIVPEKNKKELSEIPANIKRKIEFITVRDMNQVIPLALVEAPKPATASVKSKSGKPRKKVA
jgi:ATP-dependent Lon protease